MSHGLEEGSSSPVGATPSPSGVNFSVFSRHATGVQLLLFDRIDDARPARTVRLDPSANRTYHYWHVFVPDAGPGQLYGYRVDGPFDPSSGMRFDPAKVLLDPYSRGVMVPVTYCRDAARRPGDNTGTAMKSVVVDVSGYDWEGDAPLRRASSRTIVYEMHVRGFTRHPAIAIGRSHAPWWCCSPASSRSANRRAAVELCMRRDQGIARRAMNLVWAGVRETRGKALEEM